MAVDEAVDGLAGVRPVILDEASLASLFTPSAIIDRLGLKQPVFQQTARDGHFGIVGLPWERSIDLDGLIATGATLPANQEY
jgi:S-adenosylmethionine synthetase